MLLSFQVSKETTPRGPDLPDAHPGPLAVVQEVMSCSGTGSPGAHLVNEEETAFRGLAGS